MSQEKVNILGAILIIAMFVIPLRREIVEKKDDKSPNRITNVGWAAIVVSLLIVGHALLNNKFITEQRADADRVRKDNDTLLERTERIDSALAANHLKYDPAKGTITNTMGDVATGNSGVIGVQNIGSHGTTMNDIRTEQKIYELTKEQSQFCSFIKGLTDNYQIKDKGVYLWYVKGTKGHIHFPTVKEGLKKCGFHVIQEQEIDIDPKKAGPTGLITRHNNKISIIIGDTFTLY